LVNEAVSNNPHIKFTVFSNHINNVRQQNNIVLHKPGPEFKEFLKTTNVIITTSGVESICEALYNKIPIVLFKPESGDEEQMFNYNFYMRNKMALPFTPDMNLSHVQSGFRNTTRFIEYCLTTKRRVNKIIENAIAT
jgi:UDP-N-acetylglucosamine:LPS N-acetylglucosamine transferase